jgi:hypothetical protein
MGPPERRTREPAVLANLKAVKWEGLKRFIKEELLFHF